jgi:hypothetical protein
MHARQPYKKNRQTGRREPQVRRTTQRASNAGPTGQTSVNAITRRLWNYALIPLSVAVVGLLVGAGLLWLALVHQPNERYASEHHRLQAQRYAQQINTAIWLLRQQMDQVAAADSSIGALRSRDPAMLAATSTNLQRLIPNARRVELIPRGAAEVDLGIGGADQLRRSRPDQPCRTEPVRRPGSL